MNKTDHRDADRLVVRTAARGGVWLWASALSAVVLAVLQTVLPGALGRAVDAVFGRAPTAWIIAATLVIAAITIVETLDDFADGFSTARATAWLRRDLVRHFLGIGSRAQDRTGPGDFATRVVSNTRTTGRAGVDLVGTAASVITAVGALIALALIDPWLCLTVAAGIPLLAVSLRAFLRDASGLAQRYFAVQGAIAARLGDALAGARTIAASGTERQETARVLSDLPALHREGIGMWRSQARITTQQGLLIPLLEVAVLALAGFELSRGRITPGGLLAAAEYAGLSTSLLSALPGLTRLVRARASAARVDEVLRDPLIAYGMTPDQGGDGRIEFRNVTVRAGDQVLLDDVSLNINGGTLTAVVGPTGAGKSLLTALAGRLADPDEGVVLLDTIPLRAFGHDTLRSLVGYAFERPALFGTTVSDAIAFGLSRPNVGDVVEAAKHADADEFIGRLPDGYRNTLAMTPLSGGENQRLGLARSFAHAGRVLILDDVAASLDTATEFHITNVLTTALAERTRIVVAHRASTAARADVVVWLDAGRVRAVAPHRQLWGDPAYRAIFAPEEPAPPPNGHGTPPVGAAT